MGLADRKIWTIDLFENPEDTDYDYRIVAIWEAASADQIFDMFATVADELDIDPDDYPIPNKSWRVRSIGSPSLGGKRNEIISFSDYGGHLIRPINDLHPLYREE